VGWEKVAYWSTKAAIFLKCFNIEEKLLWKAYRKSPMLFRMVLSMTQYDLLFTFFVSDLVLLEELHEKSTPKDIFWEIVYNLA